MEYWLEYSAMKSSTPFAAMAKSMKYEPASTHADVQ